MFVNKLPVLIVPLLNTVLLLEEEPSLPSPTLTSLSLRNSAQEEFGACSMKQAGIWQDRSSD